MVRLTHLKKEGANRDSDALILFLCINIGVCIRLEFRIGIKSTAKKK